MHNLYIYFCIYIFDDFINMHLFFYLRVLKSSSSHTRRLLKFRVNTSWPWHPGVSLVRTKVFELSPLSVVRSNRLARLHIESSINPLCLQIHFCTNTRYKASYSFFAASYLCFFDLLSWRWSHPGANLYRYLSTGMKAFVVTLGLIIIHIFTFSLSIICY